MLNCLQMNSDVVTMALPMSPVDAHLDRQSHYQSSELKIEATVPSSKVELSQCQLLDLSSAEQVLLTAVCGLL